MQRVTPWSATRGLVFVLLCAPAIPARAQQGAPSPQSPPTYPAAFPESPPPSSAEYPAPYPATPAPYPATPAPYPYPPDYGTPQPVPGTVPAFGPYANPAPMAGGTRIPARELFVGTMTAILQGVAGNLATSVVESLAGSITGWFARRQEPASQAGLPLSDPNAIPPGAPPVGTYPLAAGAVPSYATPVYDLQTGQADPAAAMAYAAATAGADPGLYAGIAYEVHTLAAGSQGMPVNAATHEFRTGDRFVVYFRPSVPGQLQVFNINPLGVQTLIDTTNMAAGQLSTLGPYEFAANKGDDRLRLVLTPCSSPQLIAGTRDIMNVSGSDSAGAVALVDCSALATRSVEGPATRDIRKVVVDGTTSFALDPVSVPETASGQLVPREITIVFRHL
jgi:hypothetical protein